MKSLIRTTLTILALLLPVCANAQAVDLDSFLKQVWTKYQKINREKEILALENQLVNSGEAASVNLRHRYERDNQNHYYYGNLESDYVINNRTELRYDQKLKFGPKITLQADLSHQEIDGRDRYNYPYPQMDTTTVKNRISLQVTQSLYKDLMKEFYISEANDLFYKSKEQVATAKEQYVLFKAVTAYTRHQSLQERARLISESSRLLTETIAQLEANPGTLAKKLKIQQLKNSLNNISHRQLAADDEMLDSKYYLCSLIGEKLDSPGLAFTDNNLNRSTVVQKYTGFINDLYKSELAVRESEIKAQEVKIKEVNNLSAIDPYIGGSYMLADQQPSLEKAWEFHSRPNYSIEAGLNFSPYNPQNNLKVEIEQVRLKELKLKYEETAKELNNKLNLNSLQLITQEKKIKIYDNEIKILTENVSLQKDYLAQILNSGELTAADTYTEINRYTSLLYDLENARASVFAENISWVENVYNNISAYGYARYLNGYTYRRDNDYYYEY